MKKQFEKGFVLVAALGLTLVLTAVGAGALMNSESETKYSKHEVANDFALEAAKSGINNYFSRINSATFNQEIKAIGAFSQTGVASPSYGTLPSYYMNLSVDNKAEIPTDAFIAANAGNFLLYDITNTGLVAKTTWNPNPKVQQVAMWVETYDAGADLATFPYMKNGVSTKHHVTGKTDAKEGLSFVVYAIGAYGNDRKVVRERIAQGSGFVRDLAAVNNAPRYADNPSLCADAGKNEGASGDTSSESLTSSGTTSYGSGTTYGKGLIIDSTQSFYTRAIKSNNAVIFPLATTDPLFDYDNATSSIVTGNMEPSVVYDEGKVNKINYPNVTGSPIANNYNNTVESDLFGTSNYIDYFASSVDNLFYLDAYREAANRMAGYPDGEVLNGYTVNVDSNGMGNASTLKTDNNDHARMGTLSWEDFSYNISNQIPMYGIVRVLVPTRLESTSEQESHTHSICGNTHADRYVPIISYDSNHDGSSSDNGIGDSLADSNGGTGKIIVYGSLFFDFFFDKNENQQYDMSDDFILSDKQAMTTDLKIELPVLVNPVAGGFTPQTTGLTTDYTAVGFYQDGSPSNDLITDAAIANNGMINTIAELVGVSESMSTSFYNSGGFQFVDYNSLLSNTSSLYNKADMFAMLDYYHQTRAYSSKANYSHVTLSNIATNKANFYIDSKSDTAKDTASAADVFHAFMPTGYVHGWKRAFDVTGLSSTDWNDNLIAMDSPFSASKASIFLLPKVGGKEYINSDFKDLPAIMQSAGILDLEGELNVSGIVYNSGSISLGEKANNNPWTANPSYYLDGWLASKIADCNANKTGSNLVDCIADANKDYNKKISRINNNINDIVDACVGKPASEQVSVGGNNYYCGSIAQSSTVSGQYISGATISGFGTFFEKSSDGKYIIISYDDVSTDNIPVGHDSMILRRTHWQEVK